MDIFDIYTICPQPWIQSAYDVMITHGGAILTDDGATSTAGNKLPYIWRPVGDATKVNPSLTWMKTTW
jgi:hypothetical protein